MHAEVALALENDHFPAAARQRPGYAKANHPCADHDAIDVVQSVYPRGLIEAAAAINSSTSALEVAKHVTKRTVTPGTSARSGQR